MDDSKGSGVFELETTDDGQFYQAVRHAIMAMLVTVVLYMISYAIICRFKRPHISNASNEDLTEASVYRITIYLCSFTLSVSLAASLLLPTSILSREVVRHCPNSYFFKWINGKLIKDLWNGVFLCSNLSLFVLLPFSFFFLESEGFTGSRGIVARIKETFTVLVLLSLVTAGCSLLITRLIGTDTAPLTLTLVLSTVFSEKIVKSPWFMYSYMYSMTSLLGVAVLLVCTPLGLARIFSVIGAIVMKPQLSTSLDEQINMLDLEKEWIERNLRVNGLTEETLKVRRNRVLQIEDSLENLQKRKAMSPWRRNSLYPCVLLLLLFITGLSISMVVFNILKLLLGYGPLPGIDESFDKEFLDAKYDSYMGSLGALIEIGLVGYILVASLVGFYTTEKFRWLIPRQKKTPVTTIIVNCVVVLVMSCSVPLLSAILGLTRFDLLGHYRTVEWLKNVHVIFIYNVTFAVLSALCLVKKVTTAVLKEVCNQLQPSARIRHRFFLHISAFCGMVGFLRHHR
ncbi:limb region 1 protein homolog [Bolinopsis microptera]|uniref:limb region 1 protein homolog n=1 Tax=Bolinopsis microptera TaxID=2820187 RepID=UPI003078D728